MINSAKIDSRVKKRNSFLTTPDGNAAQIACGVFISGGSDGRSTVENVGVVFCGASKGLESRCYVHAIAKHGIIEATM